MSQLYNTPKPFSSASSDIEFGFCLIPRAFFFIIKNEAEYIKTEPRNFKAQLAEFFLSFVPCVRVDVASVGYFTMWTTVNAMNLGMGKSLQ
ncbi:hypothetical protein EYZ11_007338 [Aspergillus tanneri]|uniref:Uncharacterized protein n=1 Tax=Aspergillus tanneri TaxID=1220188 RepID=A0A4S3JFI0_9EURO|nr:hypothetical protein EYZ11_007338 [Aspergillus tanneri]